MNEPFKKVHSSLYLIELQNSQKHTETRQSHRPLMRFGDRCSALSYCFAVALFSKRKEKVVVLISSVPSIGYTWYDKGCSFVCPNVTLLPNYNAYTHTHTDTHTCIHSFIFRKNFKCSSLNS